ncbi:MAG: tyrosine-type recombinase/integrase, partial [Candidatus Thermoplasmatota archaeon]|nr:tyrosine-type recombinase/integrase [Candidatus Thermoplasmatota archaeon]
SSDLEYTFLANVFMNFLRKPLRECTPQDVEDFKTFLASEKKYSKSSQYLAIKAIKHLFRSLEIQVPKNLVPPRRARKMPTYLTEREMADLLDSSKDDMRANLIISLLANTGIRVGELCKIRLTDVDLEERIVHIKSGKGDKDRIVVIPDTTAKALSDYLKQRILIDTDSPYLILSNRKKGYDPSTIERIVKNIAAKSGIQKHVTPHVLRHTFATAVLRNGGDIRFIQQILGHASLNTTEIYTHIDDSALKEMYEKHRPRY